MKKDDITKFILPFVQHMEIKDEVIIDYLTVGLPKFIEKVEANIQLPGLTLQERYELAESGAEGIIQVLQVADLVDDQEGKKIQGVIFEKFVKLIHANIDNFLIPNGIFLK